MNHYQEQFRCSKCGRELIVDIISVGTEHQSVKAVTCKECATHILGDKIEEIKLSQYGINKT